MKKLIFKANTYEYVHDVSVYKSITDYNYIVNKYLIIPLFSDKDHNIIGDPRVQDLINYLGGMGSDYTVDRGINNEDLSGNNTQIVYVSTNQMILDGFVETPDDREFLKTFESEYIKDKHTPRHIFKFSTDRVTKEYFERIIKANTCLINQDIQTYIIPDADELNGIEDEYIEVCTSISNIIEQLPEGIQDIFLSNANCYEYLVVLEPDHLNIIESNKEIYELDDVIINLIPEELK